MSSKLVSLSSEAYRTLLRRKKADESFSQVIVREMGKKTKPDIMQFAGIFSGNANKWKEVEKQIYRDRHEAKMREFK